MSKKIRVIRDDQVETTEPEEIYALIQEVCEKNPRVNANEFMVVLMALADDISKDLIVELGVESSEPIQKAILNIVGSFALTIKTNYIQDEEEEGKYYA